MIRFARACLALVLLSMPLAASGQAQEARTIELGTSAKGATSSTDFYRFGAASGTTVKATLEGAGPAALIIYTPAGEEMLSVTGSETVTLEAILPLTDVFMLGVVRPAASKPYTLNTSAEEPDAHQQGFAKFVGYSLKPSDPNEVGWVQCWTDPGHKLRETFTNGAVREITLGRAGRMYHSTSYQGKTWSYQSDQQIVGSEMVRTITSSNGKTEVLKSPLEDESIAGELTFVSYHCP